MRNPPVLEMIVFVAGLTAATVAGVTSYRWYGMYGNGPSGPGFSRKYDPVSKTYRLMHDSKMSEGRLRRFFGSNGDIVQAELDRDGDGNPEESVKYARGEVAAVGFSRTGNGVIDAWVYRGPDGLPSRIEIASRDRNVIDRWETYAKGLLARVDLDTNGNGKRDRWETYEGGRLTATVVDANEDGKPDGR